MERSVWRVMTWEHDFGMRVLSEHWFPATGEGKKAAEEYHDNYDTTAQFSADRPELAWVDKLNRNVVDHTTD